MADLNAVRSTKTQAMLIRMPQLHRRMHFDPLVVHIAHETLQRVTVSQGQFLSFGPHTRVYRIDVTRTKSLCFNFTQGC